MGPIFGDIGFCTTEEGNDRLSQNAGKELQLLAA